jgi:hypothetical protein
MSNDISILQWGELPADVMLDEADLSIKTLSRKASRTKKTYKNAKGATNGLRYIDPLLTFSFTAVPSAAAGLAIQHPGTGVTSLLNFAAAVHDFDPSEGVLIYEDPEDTFNQEDPQEIKFDVVQYSFVTGTVTEIA